MQNHRNISLIVLHCSATRVTQSFTIEQLEACHKARGYSSVGYHYYITRDGTLYPCRPENEVGAHALHFNKNSIGICYEGGLDAKGRPADTRTEAQKITMEELLRSLCVDFPDARSSVTATSPASARPVPVSTPANGSRRSISTSETP